ncbi:S41 family peptidase [Christensenella tenuis]|uniref:S41 family peptidase n=1 Tax=Christensenella tenuis TaxID=2763033 RepID=A0ABR7ECE8_9FIRM|nr:S41 family peptidase [Christensenella tenuis]MBC5647416.1 S41 family peptidase [Christensenella tenuis]
MERKGYWKGFAGGTVFLAALFMIITLSGSAPKATGSNLNLYPVFGKMEKIQALIDEHFYFEEDAENEEYYIYQGMIGGLGDQYSYYMDANEYAAYQRKMNGNYCGMGATVTQDPDTLETSVVSVEPNGPAEKAGVQEGDVFLEMDGNDVTQMELGDLIETYGIGPEGSVLSLKVWRPSENHEYDFEIVREPIVTQTVFHQMLEEQTGYIQVTSFQTETAEQFKQAVDDLLGQGAEQIVYDLRGNLGGSLNSAVDMLDYLLPDGLLVYTADKNGVKQSVYEGKDGHEVNLPAVILVDENSASAAEVFSSAMRDYERALLVGTKTFGKGIVQETFPVGDGSVVRLTTTAYFTKNGYPIQGHGLEPDITVEMDPLRDPDAPLSPEEDAQLQAAMEMLSQNG